MANSYDDYSNILVTWEQTMSTFLEDRLREDTIKYFITAYQKDPSIFFTENTQIPPSLKQAVAALVGVRKLLEFAAIPVPAGISSDQAADVALLSFQTGLFTGMCSPGRGMEVFENAHEKLRQIPSKANDLRHAPLREFKAHAAKVARAKWEGGSTLTHNKMKTFLIEEHQEEGKHPFMNLPGKRNSYADTILLEVCKEVAKEMGRPDLICGNNTTQRSGVARKG